MNITVNVSRWEDIRQTLAKLGTSSADAALKKTVEDVEQYVREQAAEHNVKGALVRSIETRRAPDGQGWEIFHNPQVAPHALFVHWGTKPHVIRPRNKKVLRWPAGGRFAFAREVHHPGTRSDTWMLRAADLAPRIFAWRLDAALQAAQQG